MASCRSSRVDFGAAKGDAVAIVDSSAIAENKVLVQHDNRRPALNAKCAGQSLTEILQDREGNIAIVAMHGDAIEASCSLA